ncbi:MAG: carboxylate--amine ligase [Candidatus Parabeggiatoa sp. nov. 1]|nr:MAG: carboxylate--amine ligase [Gammaproteobacteria bacterium]
MVGVTGLNASDNPAPGIGVARSLKEDKDLKVKIAGLAYDAMEPGIYMDWFIDKSFLIPYPTAGYELMERLLYIKNNFGLDVVVPTLDNELPFFMKYRSELENHGIRTCLPSEEQFRLRSKVRLATIAEQSGLQAPKQAVVSSYNELATAVQDIGLPIMVKGALYKAYRAYTLEEAMAYFGKIVAQWGYPVIIQQAVTGEEMTVVGVGNGAGDVPGLVAIKKMSVTELGKIWTGVTILHQGLLEAARRFVATTHWQGGFEMECLVDQETVYLFEINPRFPAWVYFATGVGINLPTMLVKQAMGETVAAAGEYQAGKLYIRYTDEQICDMARFQNIVTRGES